MGNKRQVKSSSYMFPGGGLVCSHVWVREIESGNEEQSSPLSREYAALSARLAITEQISLHKCTFKWQAAQHPGPLMDAHMHALCGCKIFLHASTVQTQHIPQRQNIVAANTPILQQWSRKDMARCFDPGVWHISNFKSGIAAPCTYHNPNSTCLMQPQSPSSHAHVCLCATGR